MTVYRDESSLKLLLGATGLLCTSCCNVIPSVCDVCDDWQPTTIQLNLSGFVDVNPTICTADVGNSVTLFPGGTSALLNGDHTLEHISDCLYRKDIVVDYEHDYWTITLCTGAKVGVRSHTFLRLTANGAATGVVITVQWLAPDQSIVFIGTLLYTGDDVCFDTANTVDNTRSGGPCSDGGGLEVGTGTVGVTL